MFELVIHSSLYSQWDKHLQRSINCPKVDVCNRSEWGATLCWEWGDLQCVAKTLTPGFQSWVRVACSGDCPSHSALVVATTIFHQTVLCVLLKHCHHPGKPQLYCCGAGDLNWRINIFSEHLKNPFTSCLYQRSAMGALTCNTTEYVSSSAVQQSKIAYFFMAMSK